MTEQACFMTEKPFSVSRNKDLQRELAGWPAGLLACWPASLLAGWHAGWLVGWVGWMASWLDMAGWLHGQFTGRLSAIASGPAPRLVPREYRRHRKRPHL